MEQQKKPRIYGGYKFIYNPNHPKANNTTGYVEEHRIVIEESIGRLMKDKECVHHIDKDKLNNNLKNLKLCKDNIEHQKLHPEKLKSRIMGLKRYNENQRKLKEANKNFDRSYERQHKKTKLQQNKKEQYTLTIPKWIVKKVLCAENGSIIKFDFKGNRVILEKEE